MTFDAESFLKQLTRRSGVYQMMGADGEVLYVGKAKNLKSRVTSYFRSAGLTTKTIALVNRNVRLCVIAMVCYGCDDRKVLHMRGILM